MSRIARRHHSLRSIVALRRVAESSARSAAALARRSCEQADAQRDAEDAKLMAAVDDWATLHNGDILLPELAAVRAGAINLQGGRLAAATSALAVEQESRDQKQRAQYRSAADRDCAEDLWRRSRFRYDLWREEKALADLCDAVTVAHFSRASVRR